MLYYDGLREGFVMSRCVSQTARSSDKVKGLVVANCICYEDYLKGLTASGSFVGKRVSNGPSVHKVHQPHSPHTKLNHLRLPRSDGFERMIF